MTYGKKIGKYEHKTVAGLYKLDVRVDVSMNKFWILVPSSPKEAVDLKTRNYDALEASTLAEAKNLVAAFLKERDTTTFKDVIEYTLDEDSRRFGSNDDDDELPTEGSVSFEFRVARVSEAKTKDEPSQEIPVRVDEEGNVVVETYKDEPKGPRQYRYHYTSRVPFTLERLCHCREAVQKIRALKASLHTHFKEGS